MIGDQEIGEIIPFPIFKTSFELVRKRVIVKYFLRVNVTAVLAFHWILRIVLANQRPQLPLVARNIQPVSFSKTTLQQPFIREALLIQ